jgi:geranylgeranyl diphosphate synthase type II
LIHEAMRYSVFGGGKRLRAILVMAAAEAVGCKDGRTLPLAAAIELIHTYSLIHDDLPAMDNSNYRRGQLSCHKKFGEAVAILAGDALLTLAFSLICQEEFAQWVRGKRLAWIVRELAEASGSEGMIGGQTIDILSQGREVDLSLLHYIHNHKTGALIRASVRLGATVGRASSSQLFALTDYGEKIGLAFQIMDDVLDVEGEEEQVGKELRRDGAKGKATYPGLLGLDSSKREAKRLVKEAIMAISSLPAQRSTPLRAIAEYIIRRRS